MIVVTVRWQVARYRHSIDAIADAVFLQCVIEVHSHGRPQGGGAREFEKMTSYAAVLQNTLKDVYAQNLLNCPAFA